MATVVSVSIPAFRNFRFPQLRPASMDGWISADPALMLCVQPQASPGVPTCARQPHGGNSVIGALHLIRWERSPDLQFIVPEGAGDERYDVNSDLVLQGVRR